MKNPFRKASDSAGIEAELKRLENRKSETERRRSEVLQALEEAKVARRSLLDGEPAAIDAASGRIRSLSAEASDLGELIDELEIAISFASDRLRTATDAEQRRAAANELEKIASAVQAFEADLEKAVSALAKTALAMISAIPVDLGVTPGHSARRPENRKEIGMLTGREVISAIVADALAHAAPELFDDFHASGYRRALFAITDKTTPAYGASNAPEAPLAASDAIRVLITDRLKARAASILKGEETANLGGAEFRQELAREINMVELIALNNITMICEGRYLPTKKIITKGETMSFSKSSIDKLLSTKAFASISSVEAQKIRAEINAGPKRGVPAGVEFSDCNDLGDPLNLLAAESEESERAIA